MYKYIKSTIDMDEVESTGLESMWADKQNRDDIIQYIQKEMNSRDILSVLEDELDEDLFSTVVISLAKGLNQ